MNLIMVGITTIDGSEEFVMSNNSMLGKRAAKAHSSLIRSILFEMNMNEPFIYKSIQDGIISYSLIINERIYTICTDKEIYPYTPVNINYLQKMLQHIIDAHSKNNFQRISEMITEGESHQPTIDTNQALPQNRFRIFRLSRDHLNKLEASIKKIDDETSKLNMSATFFAPKPKPVKKTSSIISHLRWLFGFFSFCGGCINDPQENRYQKRRF